MIAHWVENRTSAGSFFANIRFAHNRLPFDRMKCVHPANARIATSNGRQARAPGDASDVSADRKRRLTVG
jgi:hypothetical protein